MMIWKSYSAIFKNYYIELTNYAIQIEKYNIVWHQQQYQEQQEQKKIKMHAKGPNNLNLQSYSQNGSSKYPSSIPNNDSNSIEQQFDIFVQQMNQYDSILSASAKNLYDAANLNYDSDGKFITDFYPQFVLQCNYQDDQEKKTIASSNIQMMRILGSLEKNNYFIKEQLKGWYFQFAKKTRFTQILIEQNKLLRRFVSKKNKQIIKLIQGITSTQNNDMLQLENSLNELKQQNGILIDHLKQLKHQLKQNKNGELQLAKALDQANYKKLDLQSQMLQNEDKQEHTAKCSTLANQIQSEYTQRQKYLIGEKKRLIKLKQQYAKDKRQIDNQIQRCQIDRKDIDSFLKIKFQGYQDEKQKLNNQIEQHTENYQNLSCKNTQLSEQVVRNESRLQQHIINAQNLDRKLSQASEQLRQKQKQFKQIFDTEVSVQSAIDILDLEIKQLKQKKSIRQNEETEHKQKLAKQLKQFQNLKNDQVQRWTKQYQKSRKDANVRVLEQKNNIQLQKKQIQQLQNQIKDSNMYFNSLMQQLRQSRAMQIPMQVPVQGQPGQPMQIKKVFYPLT